MKIHQLRLRSRMSSDRYAVQRSQVSTVLSYSGSGALCPVRMYTVLNCPGHDYHVWPSVISSNTGSAVPPFSHTRMTRSQKFWLALSNVTGNHMSSFWIECLLKGLGRFRNLPELQLKTMKNEVFTPERLSHEHVMNSTVFPRAAPVPST